MPPSTLNPDNKPKGPFGTIPALEIKQGGSLGSLGLNLETYFAGNLNDTNARLDRLEGAVGLMHRDLKILAPSMQRLALIEADLQDLVTQLETMLQEGSPAAAPVPGPVSAEPAFNAAIDQDTANAEPLPATTAPTQVTPPPAATPEPTPAPTATPAPAPVKTVAGNAVSGIRFGVDGGKTRIVFDANAAITYTKDLDNTENLLVVELPGMGWSGAPSGTAPASSHVKSWSAQPLTDNNGTRIIMILNKAATLSYEAALKPEASNPHYRLVLDLR